MLSAKSVAARLIILSELQSHAWAHLNNPTVDKVEKDHSERMVELKSNGLWEHTTPSEKDTFNTCPLELGSECAGQAFYSTNAQGVLAWCLDLIEGMPPYDTALTDEGSPYSDRFFEAVPIPEEFPAEAWRLRSPSDIDEARVEAEPWHWRSRTLNIQRSKPITKSSTKSDFYRDRVREVALLRSSEGLLAPIEEDFPAFGKPFTSLSDDEWTKVHLITLQRHKALNWVCGMAPRDDYDQTPMDT